MNRKKKESDQITLAYMAAGVLIVAVMTLFGISAFLKVNNIVVKGMVLYSPEQVAEASGISRGNNLLYLSRKNTQERIKAELTYVSSVVISRDLPDVLVIEVTESTPVAYIPFAGEALIIDSSGRVLDTMKLVVGVPVEIAGTGLIEVLGVPIDSFEPGKRPKVGQGSESSFQTMTDLLTAIEKENLAGKINYLDVTNITNISFGYMDMYRIIFGGLSNYKQKIAGLPTYVARIQESFPNNVRGVFNMTDPTGNYNFAPEQ